MMSEFREEIQAINLVADWRQERGLLSKGKLPSSYLDRVNARILSTLDIEESSLEFHKIRIHVCEQIGDSSLVIEAFEESLNVFPDSQELKLKFADALFKFGNRPKTATDVLHTTRALELYEELAFDGLDSSLGSLIVSRFNYNLNFEKALNICEKFLERSKEPKERANLLYWKTALLIALDRDEEAISASDESIAIAPDLVAMHYLRTLIDVKHRDLESEFRMIFNLLPNYQRSVNVESFYLNVAAANIAKTAGSTADAFMLFNEGRKTEYGCAEHIYSHDQNIRYAGKIIENYPREFFTNLPRRKSEKQLVFVVGMPRTRTTLVANIIGAHHNEENERDVINVGEYALPAKISKSINPESDFPGAERFESQDEVDVAAATYFDLLNYQVESNSSFADFKPSVFVNKYLQNVFLVGQLKQMFPDAKFVWCQRKPEHMVNSIYCMGVHAAVDLEYVSSLKDICRYYNEVFLPLMNHWKKVLPEDSFLEISTDSLVKNPNESIPSLISFCGLEFSKECLSPEHYARTFETDRGARKPISDKSFYQTELYRESWGELLGYLYPDKREFSWLKRTENFLRRRSII